MHKVGENIDSWCSKCKKMLAHTIEAIVGKSIKRVHCNTCKGAHVYRASEPGTKVSKSPAAKKVEKAAKVKTPRSNGEYAKLMENAGDKKARAYNFKGIYEKGELIEHAQFGLGHVVAQKDTAKIEVLFADGAKLLVQGR